ncbi:hypothetical protein SAMN04487911_13725 [Arenibacter nanhaiticus]|uniref:CHRD domain-containing protein n=1 Tax=Arenibacter nanhaiticus TaxID=558155 RepID=A0A1M6M617_9FLAO|nr:CHRD domain-containing protein [Arenibacter nanhaiticus]SHJ78898.1 hypothetical protein SAMN04487911_13725 [Arenibacter nanhaiticus]
MKKYTLLFLASMLVFVSGCGKDEFPPLDPAKSRVYSLSPVANSKISGTVTFTKNDDGTTTVLIELSGSSTDVHPAFIRLGKTGSNGEIVITLEPIDCDCESGISIVKTLDDGTPITFDELVKYEAYITIHQNKDHLEVIILQGNIGNSSN